MVELDVKDVAHVAAAELAHHLARVQVPYLDGAVIRAAHEPPRARVERERADEVIVPGERAQAHAQVRVPDLDLAVVRAGHDQIALRDTPEGENETKPSWIEGGGHAP